MISVIVPSHNRVVALPRALDSVLAQTYTDLQVIVVDDGSTDGTSAMLEQRYGAEPRVTRVRQERTGVAGARNTGLQRARGELIAFLDSDDSWRPWKLALQVACLARVPSAGMIWCNMEAVDAAGGLVPGSSLRDILTFRFGLDELFAQRIPLSELPETPPELRDRTLYAGDIYAKMVLGNLVLPSAALMTRERVEAVGPYDVTLEVAGEDFDYFLRTCRAGPVAFADVPGVLKEIGRQDQLTRSSLYLARNYLRTMEGALARDGKRIDLPAAMVRRARAYGQVWAAQGYLEAGDSASARRHLRRGLRLDPGARKALVLSVLALLPGWASGGLMAGARRAVDRLRSR